LVDSFEIIMRHGLANPKFKQFPLTVKSLTILESFSAFISGFSPYLAAIRLFLSYRSKKLICYRQINGVSYEIWNLKLVVLLEAARISRALASPSRISVQL
jgi:hypothetical protein